MSTADRPPLPCDSQTPLAASLERQRQPCGAKPAGPPPTEVIAVTMSDGYKLRVSRYRAVGSPKAIILFSHGIQSHAGWYSATSHDLARAGYDVWFADRRGSGLNSEQRGHARSAHRLLCDVREVARVATESAGDVSTVVAGVCWGGKIAAAAAASPEIPTDGLLLLYPALFSRFGDRVRDKLKLSTVRFLGAQRRLVPLPLTPAHFTSDREWQSYIQADPLRLENVSIGMLAAGRELDQMRAARQISCPSCVFLAGRDAIVDNARVQRWAGQIAGGCEVSTFSDSHHVLEFESVRPTMLSDTVNWLKRHVGSQRQE